MFPIKPTFCRLMMQTGRRILPGGAQTLTGTGELLTGSILFAKLCSWWQRLKIGQFEQKSLGPRVGICTSATTAVQVGNSFQPGWQRFTDKSTCQFQRSGNTPASKGCKQFVFPSLGSSGSGDSWNPRAKHPFPTDFASVKHQAQTTNSVAQREGSRLLYCKGGRATSAETRAGGNT